jgi:hypothetical protein
MHLLNSRLAVFALISALSVSVSGQQKSTSNNDSKDAFVGKWRLNVEKSSLPPEQEMIAIENQENGYKISLDVTYNTEDKFWTVTDMKGTPSKLTQEDGKPMNEEWRVTREGPEAFVVDSRPFRRVVRYKVSPDGQFLTMREVSSEIVGGKRENGVLKPARPILVFEKIQ